MTTITNNAQKRVEKALSNLETKIALWHDTASVLYFANKAFEYKEQKILAYEPEYCECTYRHQILADLEAKKWYAYHNVDRMNLMVYVASEELYNAQKAFEESEQSITSMSTDDTKF